MSLAQAAGGREEQRMLDIVKRQRIQDFFFHKVTLSFSLLVLVALLASGSCPSGTGRSAPAR